MTWKKIILHHSATPDGKLNDWAAIKLWHTGKIGSADIKSPDFNPYIAKPMQDVGYNYGLEYENGILLTKIGRPLTMVGAHTLGQNTIAIGICIVGNFDKIEPTHEQYMAVAVLCSTLTRLWGIPKDEIHGHNEYALKTCPGRLFDIEKVKELLI
jgi:hypothetical protein